MTVFLTTCLLLLPFVFLKKSNLTVTFSDHVIILTAVLLMVGITLGYFDFKTNAWISSAILLALVVVVSFQTDNNVPTLKRAEQFPNALFIAPFTFFIASVTTAFFAPTRTVGYLLNTWDGSSNAGIVVGVQQIGAIDFYPENKIGDWTAYPSGGHYLVTWFVDLIGLTQKSKPETAALGFIIVIWFLYAFLILQLGRVAFLITGFFTDDRKINFLSAILTQAILLSPMMIEEVLKLHSIAFVLSLSVATYITAQSLILVSSARTDYARYFLILSLSFLVSVHSYPLALPIVALAFIPLLIPKRFRELCQNIADQPFHYVISVAILSIACVSFASLVDASDPASKVTSVGHMYVVDLKWIYLALVTSFVLAIIAIKRDRLLGLIIGSITTTLFLMWRALWLFADSNDRSYGSNYYQKKMEYFLLILLLPFAVSLIISLFRFNIVGRLQQSLIQIFLSASIIFTAIQFINGAWNHVPQSILKNEYADEIVPVILREADIPGRSIIWDNRNTDVARAASFLSNYLDPTSWRVAHPDPWDLNVILHQQLVARPSDAAIEELCPLVNSDQYGKGRVIEISHNLIHSC